MTVRWVAKGHRATKSCQVSVDQNENATPNSGPCESMTPAGIAFLDQQPFSGYMKQVHDSACVALEKLSASSPETARDGISVWKKAKCLRASLEVPESTFIQYLSKLAKDDRSFISCEGRKQGYFLAEEAQELAETNHPVDNRDIEKETGRKEKEKLLYPVLVEWARGRGYSADDLSGGTAMGKWGNPDVVGIDLTEHLGGFSVEILTIEAKTEKKGWEMWIFECVSHRRFANRAYFAFAYPQDLLDKEFGEMRYYAELVGVGLLVLGVKNKIFRELKDGERKQPLTLAEVDIRELYSALSHLVPLKQQKVFCERAMSCPDLLSLTRWGKKPEVGVE